MYTFNLSKRLNEKHSYYIKAYDSLLLTYAFSFNKHKLAQNWVKLILIVRRTRREANSVERAIRSWNNDVSNIERRKDRDSNSLFTPRTYASFTTSPGIKQIIRSMESSDRESESRRPSRGLKTPAVHRHRSSRLYGARAPSPSRTHWCLGRPRGRGPR